MYVRVEVDVDASEVLKEMSDEELVAEIERRRKRAAPSEQPSRLLERVYQEFRDRRDAPPSLRDYIYAVMGRIL